MTSTTAPTLVESIVATPVGDVRILTDHEVVVAADFADGGTRLDAYLDRHLAGRARRRGDATAASALQDYLEGDLDALTGVEIRAVGSPFQQDVWKALRQIPAGSTWTYAELGAAAGHERAARAAGTANGANPISIFVPCHRVVPATGGVGGYAGGPTRKAWLLRHEGAATTLGRDSRQAVGSST